MRDLFETNVGGTLYGSLAAADHLRERGGHERHVAKRILYTKMARRRREGTGRSRGRRGARIRRLPVAASARAVGDAHRDRRRGRADRMATDQTAVDLTRNNVDLVKRVVRKRSAVSQARATGCVRGFSG